MSLRQMRKFFMAAFIAAMFLCSTPLIANAAVPAVTGEQVTNTLNCIAGQAGGMTGEVTKLFTFNINGGAVGALAKLAIYYERLCFAVVLTLLILHLVLVDGRGGLDAFIVAAMTRGFGPSLLFAAGLYLTGAGHQLHGDNFVPNMIVQGADLGKTIANDYSENAGIGSAALAASESLNIAGAVDSGHVNNIISTGICSAQAVVFGAPPVATGNGTIDKMIAIAMLGAKGFETLAEGPEGIIVAVVMLALKVLMAMFLLWVITRVSFECFILFITKSLILPMGLIFFALGQLQFISFLREGYPRLVLQTFARVVMLALLLPIFLAVMIGACVLATITGLDPIGEYIGIFVEFVAIAFLNFFVTHYKEYADAIVSGNNVVSGRELAGAFAATHAATAGVISNAVVQGVRGAMAGGVASMVTNVAASMVNSMNKDGEVGQPSTPITPETPPAPPPPAASSGSNNGSGAIEGTYEPPMALSR